MRNGWIKRYRLLLAASAVGLVLGIACGIRAGSDRFSSIDSSSRGTSVSSVDPLGEGADASPLTLEKYRGRTRDSSWESVVKRHRDLREKGRQPAFGQRARQLAGGLNSAPPSGNWDEAMVTKGVPGLPAPVVVGRGNIIKEQDGAFGYVSAQYGATIEKGWVEVGVNASLERGSQPLLAFRLDEIRVGRTILARGGEAAPSLRADDRTVAYERDGIEERYIIREKSFEQTFVIPQLPPGRGEITVTGSVSTNLDPPAEGTTGSELTFTHKGVEKMSISHAIAIDDAGKRLPLELAYADGKVSMSVPAEWVARAKLPVVIDPLIGGPSTLSTGVGGEWSDIEYDTARNSYLVVYSDRFGAGNSYQAVGQLVSNTGAPVGSPFVIYADAHQNIDVRASYDPATDQYLVLWEEVALNFSGVRILGSLVSGDGSTVSAPFQISEEGANPLSMDPDVAFDGTNWCVAYAPTDGTGNQIRARFVSTSGVPGVTVDVKTGTGIAFVPDITYADGLYTVGWGTIASASSMDISARTMDTSGAFQTPITVLAQGGAWRDVDVSAGEGRILVTWTDVDRLTIRGRVVDTNLSFLSSEFIVATGPGLGIRPVAAYSQKDKEWVVVYTSPELSPVNLGVTRVSMDGIPFPQEELTSGGSTSGDDHGDLVWNSDLNEMMVVFQRNIPTGHFILVQRYGKGVTAPSNVLFVVGDPALNVAEGTIESRLEMLGYTVTVVDDDLVAADDADGKALVVISSTTVSTKVGTTFTTLDVPVINWEPALHDDLGMTGLVDGVDYQVEASQSDIAIVDSSHPLAAGFSGTVTAVSSPQSFTWGVPNAQADVVGTLTGDPSRSILFGYEAGASMPGLTAPARRVGFFFFNDTAAAITSEGLALFDAAVCWATGGGPPVLFIVGNTTLNTSDQIVKDRLHALGYSVVVVDGPSSVADDAMGKALILISSTTVSGDVANRFTNASVPIINWEPALYDDLGMTGVVDGTDYQVEAAQSDLAIVDGSHPLAAGLTGTVTPVSSPQTFTWGVPNGNAAVVGTLSAGPNRAVVFGYESGAVMPGLTAPERRVGLYLFNDTASAWTGEGAALFDAAVAWATRSQMLALFVTGDTKLNISEQVVRNRMQALGYTVLVKDGPSVVAEDETGKSVIVISSTTVSGTVGSTLTNASVPIINWEPALHDDLGMTGLVDGTDYQVETGQTDVSIIDTSHPLAAGLSGTVAVVGSPQSFTWGVPNANAATVGTLSTDPNRAVVFGYDTGAVMPGLVAPARRVGFFLFNDTAASITNEGLALLDAALSWATGAGPEVLFIVGDTSLSAADTAVKNRLEALGFSVVVKDGASSDTADATGKVLVVISSTTVSTSVASKFTTVTVPVVNWEPALHDDLGLTGLVDGTDYQIETAQTTLSIVDSAHPLAAGLSGTVTPVTSAQSFTWGVPNGNAATVGTLSGDPNRAVIFGYEAGASMPGLVAPGRRVGLFLFNDTASALTAEGLALFDAAIIWAGGSPAFLPSVFVTAPDETAGEPGSDTATFTITRSGTTISPVTVYFTVSGTATGGVDYTSISSPVTIPAGAPSVSLTVTPLDDGDVEGSESVIVTVTPDASYFLATPSTKTVTITDNDQTTVTVVASDPAASETGQDTGTFTVTRTGDTSASLTVHYTLSGSATNTDDYFTLLGTRIIPAGQASRDIVVTPVDDLLVEGDETVALTLAPDTAYSIGSPAGGVVVISDNDLPVVTITATDPDAAEAGPDSGAFTVSRTGNTAAPLIVNYTIGGTAASGGDYSPIATQVVIPTGLSSTVIAIAPVDDSLVEGDETVVLTLAADPAYAVGSPSDATVTITDNDLPEVTITASSPTASEAGPTEGAFTISRTGDTSASLTVSFALAAGSMATETADFAAIGTSAVIPVGAASTVITISPVDDALTEADETVILDLAADPGYTIGTPSSATVTILDNDLLPVVTVVATDPQAAEQDLDPGTFTVSRTGDTTSALNVAFSIAGTATMNDDFGSIVSAVTIPAGQVSAPVTVTPIEDTLEEGDETVTLLIDPDPTYTVGTPSTAVITILENDFPFVSLTAPDSDAAEAGPDSGAFQVSRTGDTTNALIVNFEIDLASTAVDGADFASIGVSVTIPSGSATAPISIDPLPDSAVEGTEFVSVTLVTGTGYSLGSPLNATVFLSDDDVATPDVIVTPIDSIGAEAGPMPVTFKVERLNADTTVPLIVFFALSGAATPPPAADADYAPVGPTITIPPGFSAATIVVNPVDDVLAEGSEDVTVTLSASSGYTVGTPSNATGTILDDEDPTTTVIVVPFDPDAAEANLDAGGFAFWRTGDVTSPLQVTFLIGGTAVGGASGSGADYLALGSTTGMMDIGAGQALGTVAVMPFDDSLVEGDETVDVTLIANGYEIGTPSVATVTIADDDGISVVSIDSQLDPVGSEAGPDGATFRITRSGSTSGSLTVKYTIGGSAAPGLDYSTIGTAAEIGIGETSVVIPITVLDDGFVEGTESIILTIVADLAYSIGAPSSATVTLTDNDSPAEVTITATDPAAAETGLDAGEFTVSRTGDLTWDLVVSYAITGSASSGEDYENLFGTVILPATAASQTIAINPIDDSVLEGDETVVLTLSASSQYTLGTPSSATVTLADNDDLPVVTLIPSVPYASEGTGAPGTILVSRTGDTTNSLTVFVEIDSQLTSAGSGDYQAIPASVTIPAQSTSAPLDIIPLPDSEAEADESVTVRVVSDAAYLIGPSPTASVTILDDDAGPTVIVVASDPVAREGEADPGMFTFIRSGDRSQALLVNFTLSGTAAYGLDFASSHDTTITIPSGAGIATVTVTPFDDDDVEGDETVIATLGSGSYTAGPPANATITLVDDGTLSVVSILATTPVGAEGGQNPVFTITRAGAQDVPLTVKCLVGGTATTGTDYQDLGEVLEIPIPINQASATVTILPVDDTDPEGAETVTLTVLPDPAYSRRLPAQAVATIADNDLSIVTIVATTSQANETGPVSGLFTVSRLGGDLTQPLGVSFSFGASTATSGDDYTPIGTSVSIPANQTDATILITPLSDGEAEAPETVELTLIPDVAYIVGGAATATVTIADSLQPVVTIQATTSSASEGGPSGPLDGIFTVSRTGATTSALNVNYQIDTGASTATAADIEPLSGIVLIPAGASSEIITITPVDDTVLEVDEPLFLELLPGLYTEGAPSSASMTVLDNDTTPIVSITIPPGSSDSAAEGGSPVTILVSRTGDTTSSLDVGIDFGLGTTTVDPQDFTLEDSAQTSLFPPTSFTIPAGQDSETITFRALPDTDNTEGEAVELELETGHSHYTVDSGFPSVFISIEDVFVPMVSISNTAAVEPDSGGSGGLAGSIVVSRTGGTQGSLTVDLSVAAGSSADLADFGNHNQFPTSITIQSGQTSAQLSFDPVYDGPEGLEALVYNIEPSPGASYALGSPRTTILDVVDSDMPQVSITSTDATEGGTPGTFRISRTPITIELTVHFTLGGTAELGVDYQAFPTSVTIPANVPDVTIPVIPIVDNLKEFLESVTLEIDLSNEYSTNNPFATLTLTDDGNGTVQLVRITSSPFSLTEGGPNSAASIILQRSDDVGNLDVQLSFSGTAESGVDFTISPNPPSFSDMQTVTSFTLTIEDDLSNPVAEIPEDIVLTLVPTQDYDVANPSEATIQVFDNETDRHIYVEATLDTVQEEDEQGLGGLFTFYRTGDLQGDLVVNYVASGTAVLDQDYIQLKSSVTIPSGSWSAVDRFIPLNDSEVEGPETVIVTVLEGGGYTIHPEPQLSDTATATIIDDEAIRVSITASEVLTSEGGPTPGEFTITREGDASTLLNVTIAVTGSAAGSGGDYTESLGTVVTFQPLETERTLTISPVDDGTPEVLETVTVTLVEGTGYTVGASAAATVLIDDNEPTELTITATDPDASEDAGELGEFEIERKGSATQPLQVTLSIAGTATEGEDYAAIGSSVTIPGLSSTYRFPVIVVDDTDVELPETVEITVGSSSTAIVTITDNDIPRLTITASDGLASESGPDAGMFTISRSGDLSVALPVSFSLAGTGSNGIDYVHLESPLTIPAGEASITIPVYVIDDMLQEGEEVVELVLTADPANYVLETPSSAAVVITDDDASVSVVALDATASEEGSETGTFELIRVGDTAKDLDVTFTLTGSADEGDDYETISQPVTIFAGSDRAVVTVVPIDDVDPESTETVVLTLDASSSYLVDAQANQATLTIEDEDSGLTTAPSTFTGTAIDHATIRWSWTDVEGETGFQVTSDTQAPPTGVGTVGANVLFFDETVPDENTAFVRYLYTVNGAALSSPVGPATVYSHVHDPVLADFSVELTTASTVVINVALPTNHDIDPTGVAVETSSDGATWPGPVFPTTAQYGGITGTLPPEGRAYYRITYRNAGSVETNPSPPVYVTVIPTLVSPGPGQSLPENPAPSFDWTDIPGQSGLLSYELEVTDDVAFADTPELSEVNIPMSSYTHDETLQSDVVYYWRVRAVINGDPGPWSTVSAFSIDNEVPAKPVLVSPADSSRINTDRPTFVWAAPPDASSLNYDLEILDNVSGNVVYTATGISGTAYTFEAAFARPPDTYRWRVRATDAVGNVSADSDHFTFTVDTDPPSVPSLNSPGALTMGDPNTTLSTTSGLMLNWTELSTDPDLPNLTYQVQLDTDPGFVAPLLVDAPGLAFDANTYALPDLADQTTYFWRVLAVDSAGNTTPSETWTFAVKTGSAPAAPSIHLDVTRKTNDTSPNIWGFSPENGVEIQLIIDGDVANPIPAGNPTDNQWSYSPGLSPNKTYTVQAWAVNGTETSPLSNPAWITIDTEVNPVANLRIATVQGHFHLTWQPSGDPDILGYEVWESTDNVTYRELTEPNLIKGNFFCWDPEDNAVHYFKVVTVDNTPQEEE